MARHIAPEYHIDVVHHAFEFIAFHFCLRQYPGGPVARGYLHLRNGDGSQQFPGLGVILADFQAGVRRAVGLFHLIVDGNAVGCILAKINLIKPNPGIIKCIGNAQPAAAAAGVLRL